MHNKSFANGVLLTLPICIAFICVFSTLGMLANQHHLTFWQALSMTMFIFAAPTQAFLIENYDLSLLSLLTTVLTLNLKFLLLSAALVPMWQQPWIYSGPASHFICNSNYMLCVQHKRQAHPFAFYLGTSIPLYATAMGACSLGYFFWDVGHQYQIFLGMLAHIISPLYFVCLTMLRRQEMMIIVTTFLGIVLTPVLTVFISKQFLIGIWLIMALALQQLEEKICGS